MDAYPKNVYRKGREFKEFNQYLRGFAYDDYFWELFCSEMISSKFTK